jgi:hypothetical protein
MPTKNEMTSALLTAFTAVTTLAWTSQAHAQTVASPSAPAETVNAAPATPGARGASDDPNIDRGFLLPTAMTQPAGSVTYNNYELLLHGLSYGITDNLQASVTVLSPIVKDMPFVGFAAVKARIVSVDRFHLALQGSVGWAHEFNSSTTTNDIYTTGIGAFASTCLRADCSSLVSASATYQAAFPDGTSGRTDMVIYGGSIVHGVGRHFKLLGEVASAAGRGGTTGDLQNLDGVLVDYGVRFHTDAIAADVGFMKPISGSATDGNFILGLPFVNVSYRWQ